MRATKANAASKAKAQEVCIDLPGEYVECWRSSGNVRVILRKHRDVIFEINLRKSATYTVESKSEFYSPREKKLLRKACFSDGERFQIWVGREFEGSLVLTANGAVLGKYKIAELDSTRYGSDPKEKPEPILIVLGSKEQAFSPVCSFGDPLDVKQSQLDIFSMVEPKLPLLSMASSTRFDYSYTPEEPDVREYVAVADVQSEEIRQEVLKKLEGGPVTGKPSELFSATAQTKQDSHLYKALVAAGSVIAGSEILTSNAFKEGAGYLQEHFRALDKILMTVRIEKKAKGQYKAIFKGKPVTKVIASALQGKTAKTTHQNVRVGSKAASFVDGGFARSGKAGFGGARRIMLTAADNFKGGVKIQIIGTVVDLFVDANSVFLEEKGSKDLSEFLGRAGVTIAKAGMTAALGSVFAAAGMAVVAAGATMMGLTAAPVIAVVAIAVLGYIFAATIVDAIDDGLKIKESVANFAR
jgi:hypothetical protein